MTVNAAQSVACAHVSSKKLRLSDAALVLGLFSFYEF